MPKSDLSISYADILAAAQRLSGIAHQTPVFTSRQADEKSRAHIFFKCENFQRVGAFKFRGAYNALSCLDETKKRQGAIAFSAGNHAQAMALAGQLLGISITIVMPDDAPKQKISATKGYGAEVILYNRMSESREAIAAHLANERGLTLIPPFDHRDVIAGQATATKEFIEEVGPLDYLFVPGEITFPIMRELVREIVTVSDDQLREQIKFFAERMKIIVEPTACLAAAAVFNHVINVSNKRVGVIISGGNMDLTRI